MKKIKQFSKYERMLFERSPEKRDGVSSSGQVVFGRYGKLVEPLRLQKGSDKREWEDTSFLKQYLSFIFFVLNSISGFSLKIILLSMSLFKYTREKTLIGILFAITFQVTAQKLSLEEAVKLALDHNLNIQVVSTQNEIAKNNATIGNAGLLPKLDANGGYSTTNSTADVEYAGNIPAQNGIKAESKSYNAGLGVNYVLFNGLGNIRTYKKLQTQEDLSDVQTKLNIESTLLQVINSYFDLARAAEQLKILQNSLAISQDRVSRINRNYEFGAISKIEVLNAQVDFNNDSSNVLSALQNVKNSKNNLNFFLGRALETEVYVDNNFTAQQLNYEGLKNKVTQNNTSILLTQVSLSISELDQQLNQSQFMPRLSANLSYGYNRSENNASIVLSNQSIGLTGGLTFAWNLFDGFKKKIALENAKIMIESNALKKQEAVLTVEKEFSNSYNNYEYYIQLITLEQQNLEIAKLNLERSKELFFNGQINNVQFRQAQQNQLLVESKLNNAKFSAKIAEYQIKRLAGELVQ